MRIGGQGDSRDEKVMMANSVTWQKLDIGQPDGVKLLVKAKLDKHGYQVRLTDLGRIWGEDLTRDKLVLRAADLACSIDPSEDDDQYKILISKLRSTLSQESGTSLILNEQGGSHLGASLDLSVSAPLPGSLPPLKWSFSLQRLPETHVETDLVSPLLVQANYLEKHMQHLIEELRHKDHVISKITDRLETSGNDLTTCFPSTSNIKISRKRSQREQLARHVRGLGEFDEEAWKARLSEQADDDAVTSSVLDSIFSTLPLPSAKRAASATGGDWWLHLSGHKASNGQRTSGHGDRHPDSDEVVTDADRNVSKGYAELGHDESMQDDEFQRQQTPPGLRHHSHEPEAAMSVERPTVGISNGANNVVRPEDESTEDEDEDDLDAPLKKTNSAPKQRDAREPTRSSTPASSGAVKKLGTFGGARASPSPAKPVSQPPASSPAEKPRPRLGALGGRAKAKHSHEPASSDEAASEQASSAALPAKKSKMGVIGGKKLRPTDSPLHSAEELSATPEAPGESSPRKSRAVEKGTSPALRETSQERADRKRDQLKRELEEKARAPVKKKRKF